MRLLFFPVVAALICLSLAGCGTTQSYDDSLRSAISNTSNLVHAYNDARPNSLAGTGSACATAARELQNQGATFRKAPSNDRYAAAASALTHAYRLGEQGFSNCIRAARTLDYPLMVQAIHQFAGANAWIARARRLAR